MKVAVIGGGAVGATAAARLADRGVDVALYEAGEVGGGSTGLAAGIAYTAFTDPQDVDHATESIERFRELGREVGYSETPYAWFVTEGGERARALERGVGTMRSNGVDVSAVDRDELREEFPQIRTDDVHAAAVCRDAGCLDPAAYARVAAEEAEDAGATIHEDLPAGVHRDPLRVSSDAGVEAVDRVLVAAGANTKRVLGAAGVPIAMKPYRVQALTASGPALPMVFDATDEWYLRPTERGLLAGDGTERVEADPTDWDTTADEAFLDAVEARLNDRLVNYDGSITDAWAGLCTATPDGDPLLGHLGEGIHVATGWHGHGVMRAPAVGRVAAESVCGEEGVRAFHPLRFDGTEDFPVVAGMDER